MAIYLLVAVTILALWQFRQTQNARWRYIAARERTKLRQELRFAWTEGKMINYQREMEKVLVARGARLAYGQMGYIYIEVPELVRWLAWGDRGASEVLQRAVSGLALAKLEEVLA